MNDRKSTRNSTSTSNGSHASTSNGSRASTTFNIGQAAARSGVSAKMVRHYEALRLLPAVARTEAGYRVYSNREVHTLRFIRRARDLGFSMGEITELLKLWHNRRRASGDVKRIAMAHVEDLNRRLAALTEMRDTLAHLADCCQGNERPDCPILEDLAQHLGAPAPMSSGDAR